MSCWRKRTEEECAKKPKLKWRPRSRRLTEPSSQPTTTFPLPLEQHLTFPLTSSGILLFPPYFSSKNSNFLHWYIFQIQTNGSDETHSRWSRSKKISNLDQRKSLIWGMSGEIEGERELLIWILEKGRRAREAEANATVRIIPRPGVFRLNNLFRFYPQSSSLQAVSIHFLF